MSLSSAIRGLVAWFLFSQLVTTLPKPPVRMGAKYQGMSCLGGLPVGFTLTSSFPELAPALFISHRNRYAMDIQHDFYHLYTYLIILQSRLKCNCTTSSGHRRFGLVA